MSEPALPPQPAITDLTRFFWEGLGEHRLMILRCRDCGHYIHYPRPVCDACLATELAPEQVSGRARLYSWTIPGVAIDPFYAERPGTIYAVVELVEQAGLRMATNIVDRYEADLCMDMPLAVTFREVAPGLTLPLFRPAE